MASDICPQLRESGEEVDEEPFSSSTGFDLKEELTALAQEGRLLLGAVAAGAALD